MQIDGEDNLKNEAWYTTPGLYVQQRFLLVVAYQRPAQSPGEIGRWIHGR